MGCVSSIPICQQCAKKRSSDAVLTNINTTTTPVDVASHHRYDRTTDIGRRNTAAFPNDVSLVSSDIRGRQPVYGSLPSAVTVDFIYFGRMQCNTHLFSFFEGKGVGVCLFLFLGRGRVVSAYYELSTQKTRRIPTSPPPTPKMTPLNLVCKTGGGASVVPLL